MQLKENCTKSGNIGPTSRRTPPAHYEEGLAKLGRIGVLGFSHFHLDLPQPPGYKYPCPDSFIVYYWANVASVETFEENIETKERRFLSPEEFRENCHINRQIDRDLYEAALKASTEFHK